MEYLTAVFSSILPQLPSLILHAIGLGLSISRRREYPRVALAAGVFFGLSLLISLSSQIYSVMPIYMSKQGFSSFEISNTITILIYIFIPFHIIADIALLYAIFASRGNQPSDPNQPIFIGEQNV